jgi:cobyrinic acid a,c-diamide synthase
MATDCPRLLIAAPQGRSGKTTLSLGICAALRQREFRVQAFKKGPDYIDPSWLSAAAGHPCRTLDPFFQSSVERLKYAFERGTVGADVAVIEGNHGLFDSVSPDGSSSSAALARIVGAPILLVINATRMGRSAGAMVHGYQTFEPETPIAGVVLNNVAGKRHQDKLRTAIEEHCGIPVVGALPRDEAVRIPDRHLGLIPNAEDDALIPAIEACRMAAEKFVDIEAVIEIARSAKKLPVDRNQFSVSGHTAPIQHPTIGVIRDRVFTFYYPENFEALERAGANLVFIDALQDSQLPRVDALYIGGGFPEIFLEELTANHTLRKSIYSSIQDGLPVYAECGGLMYLCQRIHWGERSAEMVGALPWEVEVCARPQGHGYVQAEVTTQNPFLPIGTQLRGHEFHNSRLCNLNGHHKTAYQLTRGSGFGDGRDGLVHQNILASYTHLHADGSPGWAPGFVNTAIQFAQVRADG